MSLFASRRSAEKSNFTLLCRRDRVAVAMLRFRAVSARWGRCRPTTHSELAQFASGVRPEHFQVTLWLTDEALVWDAVVASEAPSRQYRNIPPGRCRCNSS